MAIFHLNAKMLSRSNGNCARSLAYRAGCKLEDCKTMESFDYRHKGVHQVELILPQDAPQWAKEMQILIAEDRERGVQAFSDLAEKHEKRIDGQVYREFEFALQRELTDEQNMALAQEFLQDQVAGRGIAVLANFHMDVDSNTGERKPHCHAVCLTRQMEQGGLIPALSSMKDRRWEKKALIQELREQLAAYTNFHLKLNGHDVRVDHRSYEEQGLDIEPQPKQGQKAQARERKLGREGESFLERQPLTDKGQAFRDVQLRNLYRIVRKPEVVFDIVTRNHCTFMWGDVQKVLHRYVDSPELFQRLESRLKGSSELLILQPGSVSSESTRDDVGGVEDRAIYTTHSLLQSEKELIKMAEALSTAKSHAVLQESLEQGLSIVQAKMQERGHSLSSDQDKAIRHLVAEGQLKCIVGYAGAGKTMALEACREIWETDGYHVYGFAPTGRAAKNLEDSRIPSQTLHKFLKSFEEGRCQYNPKSVLVLDEGGMVDEERFQTFLSAVKTLGVKAVVIGDEAQLQPIEAGPAFRIVTTRIGVARLVEIVRQKEEWQREATVLFGKQDTEKAIQTYQAQRHVHIVEEVLPQGNTPEEVLKRYEMTARTSGLIFREIMRESQLSEGDQPLEGVRPLNPISAHVDYKKFEAYREIQKDAGGEILKHAEIYKPYLEARRLDPMEMARLFVDKRQDKLSQYKDATDILRKKKLDQLIGIQKAREAEPHRGTPPQGVAPHHGVDVRTAAKQSLIEHWKRVYGENPDKSIAIMAYSNRDVRDLNELARAHLKAEGKIGGQEFTYTITREIEDDFGRKTQLKEEREFAAGDRIVFTRNKYDLGVTNGSMGTVLSLDTNKMEVELDGGKKMTFPPRMFPSFDQGWAITIHKSQGTTVDQSFVLASHEMNQNLAYVAMTRHREDVHVYGSSLDFWRTEKVADILSKSGDKLGAADYLDATSLETLMKEEDKFLDRLFMRLSDELHAMGAVSRQAFTKVANTFFGRKSEQDLHLRMAATVLREEQRAETLFAKDAGKHQSFQTEPETVFETRAKTASAVVLEHALDFKHQTEGEILPRGEAISQNSDPQDLISRGLTSQEVRPFIEAKDVEEALKQNMGSFADDVFASLGEPLHKGASSATQRRYGKNGHISVNLRTGAWINFKDSDLSGGPLHMLTKLKGMSFKEALDYGAIWSGQTELLKEKVSLYEEGSHREHSSSLTHMAQKESIDFSQKEREGQEEAEKKARIEKAQALWAKGEPMKDTLAHRYLKEHRGIERSPPLNLRYLSSFQDVGTGMSFPCLMAAVRSPTRELTAVQLTFLNPETGGKADLPVQKKSFGVIKGSFVTLQEGLRTSPVWVAEGIETALSLREVNASDTIVASLGLSNLKHLVSDVSHEKSPANDFLHDRTSHVGLSQHIIVCADHDEPGSVAAQSLEKSVSSLEEKGALVTVIKSKGLHEDFNDVLRSRGCEGIRSYVEAARTQIARTQALATQVLLDPEPRKGFIFSTEAKEDEIYKHARVNSDDKEALSQSKPPSNSEHVYSRFKELDRAIKSALHPSASLREEFRQLGHELSQDKEFMNSLKNHNAQGVKMIERMVAESLSRSLEHDRGGFSL